MKTKIKIYLTSIVTVLAINAFGYENTVNPIIGDAGFEAFMGHNPHASSNEHKRVKYHLLYAAYLLHEKDVSHLSIEKRKKRRRIIKKLVKYALAGKYPQNFDFKNERKPCFIDQEGTICAVGYLIQETEGREIAEEINVAFQYAEIYEMNQDQIEIWANENGLTLEECAIIQPSYEWVPLRQRTMVYSLGSAYRFDGEIYSKFDISYSFLRMFKKHFPSTISLQVSPLKHKNVELAALFNHNVYVRNRWAVFGTAGTSFFRIEQKNGWNIIPGIGVKYQYIKGKINFNGQLAYQYHLGLTNPENYTINRNEVAALIGLGYRF